MKTSLTVAGAIGFACAGAAHAADLGPRPAVGAKAPAFVSVPAWAGPYVGVHAGYLAGGGETTVPGTAEFHLIDPKGFAGGIVAGYARQWGRVVAGVEADVSLLSARQTVDTGFAPNPATTQLETAIVWNGHVRGRLGYAFDAALLYVAGGLAVAGVDNKAIDNTAGATASWSNTRAGWSIGAGGEVRVSPKASVRVEYLYDHYGTDNLEAQTVGATTFAARDHKLDSHTLRAGLNWRF